MEKLIQKIKAEANRQAFSDTPEYEAGEFWDKPADSYDEGVRDGYIMFARELVAMIDMIGQADSTTMEGTTLDWAIAKIEKVSGAHIRDGIVRVGGEMGTPIVGRRYSPSTDFDIGGKLMDKYKIETYWSEPLKQWAARCGEAVRYGPTRLIASARSIVATYENKQ